MSIGKIFLVILGISLLEACLVEFFIIPLFGLLNVFIVCVAIVTICGVSLIVMQCKQRTLNPKI
jgi:hypothetical protein